MTIDEQETNHFAMRMHTLWRGMIHETYNKSPRPGFERVDWIALNRTQTVTPPVRPQQESPPSCLIGNALYYHTLILFSQEKNGIETIHQPILEQALRQTIHSLNGELAIPLSKPEAGLRRYSHAGSRRAGRINSHDNEYGNSRVR